MANNEWHALFPSSETDYLEFGESDHRPLVTNISDMVEEKRGRFRYDCRLTNKEGFKEEALKGWNKILNVQSQESSLVQRISHLSKINIKLEAKT